MTRFAKIALSGLTALSLTLSPLPAAAAPDGEDILKTLAGLAVLGIIANEINDRDRNRSTTTTTTNKATNVHNPYGSIDGHRSPRVVEGQIRRDNGNNNRRNGVRRARLPDRCQLIVSTARGNRLVYGQRCLNRNYIYAEQLPDRCRVTVRTQNRNRSAYGARCLARDGWRVAGRQ